MQTRIHFSIRLQNKAAERLRSWNRNKLVICVLTGLLASLSNADQGFEAASDLTENQERHRLLPSDDIWWTVNGEQMAWMNRNLHQLFPTVNVYRRGAVKELVETPLAEVADFELETKQGRTSLHDFIHSEQSTVMGLVILQQGKIVYEAYPRMQDYEKPIYWSVAKVLPSTLLRILEERGQLDVSRKIDFYLPELRQSSFAGISVRNLLDMASGLDCSDQYESRDSCYYRYSMAIGDGHRDENAMDNPYDFVASLKVSSHAEQGERRSYSGVNTFILGWLVERLTGESFQDVFTREIWQHIGAEADASFLAYRYGIALTHGGFLSNMRDMARFGLLFTPSYGVVSDRKIISDATISMLFDSPNPNLVTESGHSMYQWDRIDEAGNLYKGGWAGQGLLINPGKDLVAVFTGYFKEDYSEERFAPLLYQLFNAWPD